MKQYYISEWLSETNTIDIPIHIYTMPLNEGDKRHSAGGSEAYQLSKLNNFQTVIFYEQYIASFKEIVNWDQNKYIKHDYRAINPLVNLERVLFERLVKKEIENNARKDYVIDRGMIRLKKAMPLKTNELLIYPAINLSVTVNIDGKIIMGFDYTHRFEFKETLLQLINKGSNIIKPGITVVDSNNPRSHEYSFLEIASYTAGEVSPLLKQSIVDYYKIKKTDWKLKGTNDASMVVHVKNNKGKVFPYLPHLLKLSCSFESLPNHLKKIANHTIKLSPGDKMNVLFEETIKILTLIPVLQFPKQNVRAVNLGYDVKFASNPSLKFGKEVVSNNINGGLLRGGVFSGKEALVSFFVDPILQGERKNQVGEFINLLREESEKLGVILNVSNKPRELRGKLDYDLFSSKNLSYHLKNLPDYFEGTVVVFTTEQNGELAYKPIKREFGGKQDTITQFINFKPSLLDIQKSRYHVLNILLGIYVKSGLQPWILADKLHSDCFIGLDVSHEAGKHSSGIIQVIGQDGRMIKQKSMATNEAGEKISWDSMQEIIFESIHSYEKIYGKKPGHITFHRDGFCREDLDAIKDILSSLEISFDYVEILKTINRRIAIYENKEWKTQQGLYYKKGNEGYLCSTSPSKYVGMAKPFKIVQKTKCLSFDDIVSDIYKLSFMHVHSMLKTRLPITTHYADLSSTFHNRGLVHPSSKHELALPFV